MRNLRIHLSRRLTRAFCLGLVVALGLGGCATQDAGQTTGLAAVDPPRAIEITSIGLSEGADAVDVVISGTAPLTYTSVKQPLPLGVVLYFPNTRLNVPSSRVASSGNPVFSIEASQVETKNETSRIEILLASDVPYHVVQDGTALNVQFKKPLAGSEKTQAPSMAQPAATVVTQPVQATPRAPIQATGTFQGTGVPVEKREPVWVNRIDFLGEADGRSTLSIETTAKVDYAIQKISDKHIELRLMDANIADFRQRPLITTRFQSAVNRIMPIQLPSMKDFSIFSIELREPVAYFTEQVGELLLLHFDASSVAPAPVDESALPAWKRALEEAIGPADLVATAYPQRVAGEAPAGFPRGDALGMEPTGTLMDADQAMVVTKRVKQYTGERIALDFFETDIKNVFRILREISGKNFAIDRDVSGKVTLSLDKPVPWDQVMDLVLRMNQLGMIVEGDIIRIATLATLKAENDLRKAQIAAMQQERDQIRALEPLETRYIPISYSDAGKEVLPHIQNIVTKDRGSVTVDSKNNQIIITDTAEKIAHAQEIVDKIDKVTSQVVIEARVVEINQEYSKELGITWNLGIGPVSVNSGTSIYSTAVAMNFPAASNSGFGLNFAKISGTPFTLDMALNAIETSGNGKILSAPKIVTLNNKTAKITQGQEIGYLERDSAGGSSVKFKDVDLMLEVTPHVTPDNRISMGIYISKNDVIGFVPDSGVPIIGKNEAETQLLVNDGDTLVIGGILKSNVKNTKSGFPGLHRIPVLGWLFQTNLEEIQNSELLIFINPKIVQLEQRRVSN
ncbi:MAG: type IV pilus secretin PilQ [Desulfosarcina sp.]